MTNLTRVNIELTSNPGGTVERYDWLLGCAIATTRMVGWIAERRRDGYFGLIERDEFEVTVCPSGRCTYSGSFVFADRGLAALFKLTFAN